MENLKQVLIEWLQKVWAIVKSAPFAFALGIATGLVLGWIV